MGVQSLLHDEQTAVNVDFLDDDSDVRDLKQVLPAAGGLKQTAGVRDGLLRVAHEGVLPVGVALVLSTVHVYRTGYFSPGGGHSRRST